MASAEKRTGRDGKPYFRGRYYRPDGKKDVVKDESGDAIRFPTKRTARDAAVAAEEAAKADAKRGDWTPPEKGQTLFADYVLGPDRDSGNESWIARTADLAASSEQSYGHHIKRLVPYFGEMPFAAITDRHVAAWERQERARGAASSVTTYRKVLHVIFEDAIADRLIATNPARRKRNRGRRAGRNGSRAPERAITAPLGALLLAERASLLSGRDTEFVATITQTYAQIRFGEVVGLEKEFVRERSIRVEWQLYELDSGEFVRCPPKDDSYRTVDTPAWLSDLICGLPTPAPCPCHGRRYAFPGRGPAGGGARRQGPTLKELAAAANVSTGTVSNVLNRPERVTVATRARVQQVMEELGYVRRQGGGQDGEHWRRSGHATWIFTPAATGWYPPKAPLPRRLVPISADPWPGVPVRGRGAESRADACWLPIREGLTRHGLRHTGRTILEEIGTPKILIDERMGHSDSSVSALYTHITDRMRARMLDDLTELWGVALRERFAMHPHSPVAALDRLLAPMRGEVGALSQTQTQLSPRGGSVTAHRNLSPINPQLRSA